MTTGKPDNRRGFLRVPFTTEVEIETGKGIFRSNKGINVSLSGLYISEIENIPATGSSCRVSIFLESAEYRVAIRAEGKVARSEPTSVAVTFTQLDLDSYHHLRQLVIHNADDPEKAEREFIAHWGIKPRM